MKFLLTAVNAKYIHSNPAVYSLRAYAGEALWGHIEIAEYTINNRMEDILADIYQRKPDVIGFSCYIWNWSMIGALLPELGKLLPGAPIWLGGPEVSFEAGCILRKYPVVTGIMVGEGEQTFLELLKYYLRQEECGRQQRDGSRGNRGLNGSRQESGRQSGAPEESAGLEKIPGLYLKNGLTAPRELTDISLLPFLYKEPDTFSNRIIYYESSRGCPFRCSYCLSSIDKQVRLRDISVVKKELQFFLDAKVPQVKFVDRTFNCNHAHAMAVWEYLAKNDNGVTNFHFEISADLLQEDELTLLQCLRPGQVQLEIGVQSTNPKTLRAIRRSMDIERLERVVASIRKGGNIHQHLDLIAGLPYEDYQSFRKSFNRVYAMRPQQLQLGFLKVLKGSAMWEEAEKYGIRYLDSPPYEVLFTDWLPFEDVLKLKGIEEMVEQYYNSGQFRHTLDQLEKAFPSPFDLFEALAGFYKKKGYFTENPARAYRYKALLAFAEQWDQENRNRYRELLLYDMYLREKLKSRPDFAEDMSAHREEIRSFYIREEEQRRYLPEYASYDWKQMSRMTHLEYFSYPVWDMEEREGGGFVLFDYKSRSPLNQEARTVVLPAGMQQ